MGWEILVPLIVQYGVPFAEKIYTLWSAKADPTPADWDALKALSNTNAAAKMTETLVRNGIDPTSAQGKLFLSLVGVKS
jgi:hypothetical protein